MQFVHYNRMKISVVIPAYNEEKYLAACLKSIHNQIRQPDELIVVDNDSTDSTGKIAKQFGATVIFEKQKGISYARNAGFNHATGDIIVRCDADTIVYPDWIANIEKIMNNAQVDAMSGGLNFYEIPYISILLGMVYMYYACLIQGFHTLNGFNMAISSSTWKKVRSFTAHDDDGIQEDNDLAIIVAIHGGKIIYIPNLIVSVSARRILENPKSFFVSYPQRFDFTMKRHWKEIQLLRKG